MMAAKKNVRRFGPVHVPTPGVPMLMIPRKAIYVHLCPAGPLLEVGIPMGSYEAYVGTPEGLQDVRSRSTSVLLRVGDALFVPNRTHLLCDLLLPSREEEGGIRPSCNHVVGPTSVFEAIGAYGK